jgi:hypothetical protein
MTLREEYKLKVFENKFLSKILGCQRDEVSGEWKLLDNEDFLCLNMLASFVRVVKSGTLQWACCIVHMGEMRCGKPQKVTIWEIKEKMRG